MDPRHVVTPFRRAGRALAAVAAGALLLAACSSSPSSTGSTTSTTSSGSSTTAGGGGTNARSDVTTSGSCSQDAAGAWSWSGTVNNPTGGSLTYTIIVDFTNSVATVVQTKTVVLHGVAGHGSASWSVSGASGHSGIVCVIRSVRSS